MFKKIPSPADEAAVWQRLLPPTIRESLNAYGVSEAVIDRLKLGWNGKEITAPVENERGEVTAVARLELSDLRSDFVGEPLYGWDTLRRRPARLIVCESVGDRILLESRGYPAVALPGPRPVSRRVALAIRKTVDDFHVVSTVAERMTPADLNQVSVFVLPAATQPGRRFFDYFVCLGHTAKDLERLLVSSGKTAAVPDVAGNATRAKRIRQRIRIEDVIGRYVHLEPEGNDLIGKCPLHGGETSSLSVFLDSQTFHCFECDADGDVIAFLMEFQGLTEGQAVERLEAMRYDDGPAAA